MNIAPYEVRWGGPDRKWEIHCNLDGCTANSPVTFGYSTSELAESVAKVHITNDQEHRGYRGYRGHHTTTVDEPSRGQAPPESTQPGAGVPSST